MLSWSPGSFIELKSKLLAFAMQLMTTALQAHGVGL
jgi:hypothetical protein